MKREVREQRLHDLVERFLTHLTRSEEHCPNHRSIDLIAHSPESPVALALAARLADLRTAQVSVRAIFAVTEPAPLMATWLADTTWVRWLKDVRLLEAHEQLVLGDDRCWSGDAMRRGSTKTDLFESLNEGSPEAAKLGRVAFERLAAVTAVIRPRRVTASLNAVVTDRPVATPEVVDAVLPPAGSLPGNRILATRH